MDVTPGWVRLHRKPPELVTSVIYLLLGAALILLAGPLARLLNDASAKASSLISALDRVDDGPS